MSAIQTLVESQLQANAVVVYAKSWCPHSRATRRTLTDMGATFQVYELDKMENGQEIQAHLKERTGQRTVPNILIDQKHIGGNSDVQNLMLSGKLNELLIAAGAIHI